MQVRTGVGWQYALADLSLILFMVVAAALARQQAAPPKPVPAPPAPAAAPLLAEPVAVWRAGPGAPSLAEWPAAQSLDPRQRLTLVARYSRGRAQEAFLRAQAALAPISHLPAATRMTVEPATTDDLSATLTWDATG